MSAHPPAHEERIARLGRWTPGRIAIVGALLLLLAFAVSAYLVQHEEGEIVTGMRTIGHGGVAWGLYICFVVYFIGISFAGISTAALVRLFNLEDLRPLTRIAELLTLVTLPMGALCVLADLGRPLNGILYLPRYARPQSPLFGTFTLVISGYLFASLVYFFLAGRADAARCATQGPRALRPFYRMWASGWRGTPSEQRRHVRVEFWMALFVLPLLVTAHSTLGFVFGIQGGRPGWYGSLQAPAFVVLAGASGIGMLIVVAAAVRRAHQEAGAISEQAFRMLGNFLWVLTVTYLYFMIVEELTATYAAGRGETYVAHAVALGRYAGLFWIAVACLVATAAIGFVQFIRRRVQVGWLVVGGLLVNVAAILKRFLIVVPSQTEGMLLRYERGAYTPTVIEIRIVLGMFALAALIYVIFGQFFPLVPVEEGGAHEASVAATNERETLRRVAFAGTLITGLGLMVTGFLLSMRFGTLPFLDPIVPYSPLIFISGVMLTFLSAAVYETIPVGARPRPGLGWHGAGPDRH